MSSQLPVTQGTEQGAGSSGTNTAILHESFTNRERLMNLKHPRHKLDESFSQTVTTHLHADTFSDLEWRPISAQRE